MPRAMPEIERRKPTQEEKDAISIDMAWLKAHTTEDARGCWVWNGFVTKQGQPQCRITIAPKVTASMLVRRLVAKMAWGDKEITTTKGGEAWGWEKFAQSRQAGVRRTCSWGCCHPEHVKMRTKFQAMAPARGRPLPLEHRLAISKARRATSRISEADIVRMITDPRPGIHVAAEMGVCPSYVPHVRTGRVRAYSAPGQFFALTLPLHGDFRRDAA